MGRNTWEEVYRYEIQDATAVANTVTETILVPNVTLSARYLEVGRVLKATVCGRYGTTGTPTITVRNRIGGVSGAIAAASAAYTLPSGVTTVPFQIEFLITTRAFGTATTGAVFTQGTMTFSSAAPNTLAPQFIPASAPAVSAGFDSTAAQDFAITVQWGTANASNTIQAHEFAFEPMN